MKSLPLASLALVASLTLTSCAAGQSIPSNKYYDKGFKIGSSESFVELVSEGEYFDSDDIDYLYLACYQLILDYKRTGDEDFVDLQESQEDSFIQGCKAGFEDVYRP